MAWAAPAPRLAEAGAVVVNYITSRTAAIETAQAIMSGRRVHVIKADVSEEDDVRSMLEYITARSGSWTSW